MIRMQLKLTASGFQVVWVGRSIAYNQRRKYLKDYQSCAKDAALQNMATYSDLSLHVRLFMKGYPFSRYAIESGLCAKLSKPLKEARVALVTTAGLRTPEQAGFDHSNKKGDSTFREIPTSIEAQTLIESHRSYAFDHLGLAADTNLAFPIDRFRELEAKGTIGQLNHRHFSFMGSIVGPGKLIEETAPQVARMLREDGVDVVFLTPV